MSDNKEKSDNSKNTYISVKIENFEVPLFEEFLSLDGNHVKVNGRRQIEDNKKNYTSFDILFDKPKKIYNFAVLYFTYKNEKRRQKSE